MVKEAVLGSFPAVIESSFQREVPATTANGPRQEIRPVLQKLAGLTEKEIVDIARNGHPDAAEAFGPIWTNYYPRVFRYELAKTGDPDLAEDLASEVMMKVWESLPKFQWRHKVPFSAWVFQIAHNQLISHRRANETRKQTIELLASMPFSAEGPEETVVNDMERRAKLQKVLVALPRLPAKRREVIELRFIAGLSVAETARVMEIGESNVRILQYKAVRQIREIHAIQPELDSYS